MKRLAAFSYRKRWIVLIGWIGLLAGLYLVSTAFRGEYRTEFKLPGSETQAAFDLLEARGATARTGFAGQVVFRAEQGVNDPDVRGAMEDFFAAIKGSLNGVEVVNPYQPENAFQISRDGRIAYAEVNFSDRSNEQYVKDADTTKDLLKQVQLPGLTVELGGDIFAEPAPFSSEFVCLTAAIIILLIAFGSLLAMGLPVITALFGIGCGAAIIGLTTRFLSVPDFTTQVALMIGLGVGIDYALIIVTRYRSALKDGLSPEEAVVLSIDTSGRAVLFAGTTVVISLLGMFVMNLDFMRSVAVGAVSAVLFTMLASVTLLPALLGFVGRNIDRLGLPHRGSGAQTAREHSFWYRWSRVIQAHPWPALIGATALLVVLAAPVFSMRLGFFDAGNRLESDTTRKAYDLLSEGFGPGFNAPILIVVDSPDAQTDAGVIERLGSALSATEGVAAAVGPQTAEGGLRLFSVFPTSSPQDRETAELVHRLRDETVPAAVAGSDVSVLVGGLPGAIVDFSSYMGGRMPFFFGAVLLLSFVLLLMVFHSLVVPLKAVIMNLLSIGAAFGAMVAVFQWGYGAGFIGLGKEGPIEAWAPVMLFAVVFGLSMDYEVFLLTRVREEYDRTGDNASAVADGLASTGRVISAAALIMVFVFGSFILSDEVALKLVGFGLASAVLIDATVVRLVLVPSFMELMGNANWWAPAWLKRVLPCIRVEVERMPRE